MHSTALSARLHPFLLPELVALIASFLSPNDILACRAVCCHWRRVFAPFLQLSGSLWNHDSSRRLNSDPVLEALGPFVRSLKSVEPTKADLDAVSRTCPTLTCLGLSVQPTVVVDVHAVSRLMNDDRMRPLERVEIYSQTQRGSAALLYCLANAGYHQLRRRWDKTPVHTSASPASPASPTANPRTLRELAIEHAFRRGQRTSVYWEHLESTLMTNRQLRRLTIRNAVLVRATLENSNDPIEFDLDVFPEEEPMTSNPGWALARTILQKTCHWAIGRVLQRQLIVSLASETTRLVFPTRSNLRTLLYESSSPFIASEREVSVQSFAQLESIQIDNVLLSEPLLTDLLSRCPALRHLDLNLDCSGDPSSESWYKWLESCRKLESVKITTSGIYRLTMDIYHFWALAPPTLKSFEIGGCRYGPVHFSTAPVFNGLFSPLPVLGENLPGSSLTTLCLHIAIPLSTDAVCCLMTNCRSLIDLVLWIQCFVPESNTNHPVSTSLLTVDATTDSTLNTPPPPPPSAPPPTATRFFPEWACGGALKRLVIKSLFGHGGTHMDPRLPEFMSRLGDLTVLERMTLPLMLMSTLVECGDDRYSTFAAMLDERELNEKVDTDLTGMSSRSAGPIKASPTGTTSMPSFLESSRRRSSTSIAKVNKLFTAWRGSIEIKDKVDRMEDHVEKPVGEKLVNYLPHMPSVQQVSLFGTGASPSSTVPRMQMKFLHILMAAIPGVRSISTMVESYGDDHWTVFGALHERFMNEYGGTGVQLLMGERESMQH